MGVVVGLLFLGFFVGSLAMVWYILYVDHDLTEEKEPEEEDTGGSSLVDVKKKKRKPSKGAGKTTFRRGPGQRPNDPALDGPPSALLVKELKGHTGQVTSVGFTNDDRFVATGSEDGTVRIVFIKTLKDSSPRYFRLAIERDHVTALAFSENNKRLVCATFKSKEILFYSIPTEAEIESGVVPSLMKSFPSGHVEPVTRIVLLDVDKWMVVATSACGSSETGIRFHNPKGDLLTVLDTNQIMNYTMVASPDNRFLAVGASMPEVKVLELHRSKTGEFQQVTRAMALTGHTKAVKGVSFNHNSSRVLTSSADGSWCMWDTSVRYNLDEDPRQLEQHPSKDLLNSQYSGCALGLDGTVAALASGRHLFFHRVGITGDRAGKQVESVGAAHGSKGSAILLLEPSRDGKMLATTAEGDKHARLWLFPSKE